MSVPDRAILLHEIAHAIALLLPQGGGALAVKIILRPDRGEAIPSFPNNVCTDAQFLAGLIGGLAYRTEGMDCSEDDAQIAAFDPELVAAVTARVLPFVEDRLECVTASMVDAMLATLEEEGALILTPEVKH